MMNRKQLSLLAVAVLAAAGMGAGVAVAIAGTQPRTVAAGPPAGPGYS